jgi:hypothetical protein
MNCIFCKADSTGSCSVEHIIPESLGNTDHVLPPGVVCDRCNTYFSIKVEKPLLETPYFRDMCYRGRIRNKQGNPPRVQGIHLQGLAPVYLIPDMDGNGGSICASREKDETRLVETIRELTKFTIVIPVPTEPDQQLLSRFLAKIAIESLALKFSDMAGGIREVEERSELNPLREYARKGAPGSSWPYHSRPLYPSDFLFVESESTPYEVLHEWTFLYTKGGELYFVLALFGIEYTINMGSPNIDGYKQWLTEKSDNSPLYPNGISGIGHNLSVKKQ